jgi:AcrR family transcriptional regulator
MASFAELGYEATSNRVIADRAGLTPAAVHHHFPTKRNLMFEVHATVVDMFIDILGHVNGGNATPAERIARLLRSLHAAVGNDTRAVTFGLVAREEGRRYAELQELTTDSDTRFTALFDDIASGVPADCRWDDADLTATLSVVTLGLAAVSLDMDETSHEEVTDLCCRLFAASLSEHAIP